MGCTWTPPWTPWWPAVALDWPDFGVPADAEVADAEIRAAFLRARSGERVEVACIGGHGRTGTVLACMAVLASVPGARGSGVGARALLPARRAGAAQQYWVERWAEARQS